MLAAVVALPVIGLGGYGVLNVVGSSDGTGGERRRVGAR
jgi:hypothetical protein